jgi:hypothetical protein
MENRELENLDPIGDSNKVNSHGDREIDFSAICRGLSDHLGKVSYNNGDLSDLGNEVGLALGRIVEKMSGEEMRTFVMGFNHGVSLTNGTHG